MPDQSDMVELSRFMTREEAELVRERLLEAGIQSVIPDDFLYNIHAGISAASGGVRLVVDAKDIEEARNIIEKSPDEYPLPQDFDTAGPAEEKTAEARKALPYGSTFIISGIAALILLGLWTAFLVPGAIVAIGHALWNILLVFAIGGLLGLVIHVCARALTKKKPE